MKYNFSYCINIFLYSAILGFQLLDVTKTLYASTPSNKENDTEFVKNRNPNLDNNFYILGPGDLISIKFVGVDELSGQYLILRDGNIQLPLLGTKNISGLSLNSAKKKIIELYSNQLIRPEIDLTLLNSRPVRVSLIGEVKRPGSYTLGIGESSRVDGSGGSGTLITGYQTVVDAIQKAGGLTFDADITKVVIYRKLPGEQGKVKKANLDLLDMIKTGNQANNPILFDGDSIHVNKISQENNKIQYEPNNLTPETIKLHIIGEVSSPGMYQLDSNTQISQAVLIAGGPKSWRHKDKIQLLRVNRNGSVEVKEISFNKKGLSKKVNRISLRDGDVIRVNKNFFGKSTDALGTFLPPIRDMYSLYGVYKLID